MFRPLLEGATIAAVITCPKEVIPRERRPSLRTNDVGQKSNGLPKSIAVESRRVDRTRLLVLGRPGDLGETGALTKLAADRACRLAASEIRLPLFSSTVPDGGELLRQAATKGRQVCKQA